MIAKIMEEITTLEVPLNAVLVLGRLEVGFAIARSSQQSHFLVRDCLKSLVI